MLNVSMGTKYRQLISTMKLSFSILLKENVLAAVNHELKREFHSVFSRVVFGTIKCALWAKFSYHTLHKCRIRIMKKKNGME